MMTLLFKFSRSLTIKHTYLHERLHKRRGRHTRAGERPQRVTFWRPGINKRMLAEAAARSGGPVNCTSLELNPIRFALIKETPDARPSRDVSKGPGSNATC
ncbi:hypothetical protein EVAR_60924_1 [Eumeta japonica]|uniref:Uncharacterized protein n=1 Tax=Eumeta variegata TaxID=151549 RepID=A0A4C1ZHQ0_EUMVA|nr:hypothetical protein EVAR_60924_1 [Eumeta japonica]